MSLDTMLLRHCTVRSRLYTTPFLTHEEGVSLATAKMEILPSVFFLPAIPVILDEPISIATIKSFAITLCLFGVVLVFFLLFADNLVVEL